MPPAGRRRRVPCLRIAPQTKQSLRPRRIAIVHAMEQVPGPAAQRNTARALQVGVGDGSDSRGGYDAGTVAAGREEAGCYGVYLRLETAGGSRSRLDGERDRARARPTRDLEIDLSGRNT